MVDIGAHHSCWLLLQALFMIASVLTAASTRATETMTNGVFMGDLAAAGPFAQVSDLQNEHRLNARWQRLAMAAAQSDCKTQSISIAYGLLRGLTT
jgi:hypothetical protein